MTPEQVADAIANPRKGDVWKFNFRGQLTVQGANGAHVKYKQKGCGKLIFVMPLRDFEVWTKVDTTTLVKRGDL